jgi:hypothetical protein
VVSFLSGLPALLVSFVLSAAGVAVAVAATTPPEEDPDAY